MSSTMRAVEINNGVGPASALYIGNTAMPKAKPSEVIVRVKAFGLNRMDVSQREGKYPMAPEWPTRLGVEFSGVVTQAPSSPEGERFAAGDEVFGLAYGGAYAEYIAVSTHMLVHKPAGLSWPAAAAVPEAWLTALQALHVIAEHTPGKSVLWHAGASGVALAGIQMSAANKAAAVYTTSSAAKIDFLMTDKSLHVTKAFDRHQDWAEQVLEATGGKGVDVIIDFVGAPYFQKNLKVAARDGRIVLLGLLGGGELPAGTQIGLLLGKRLRIEGSGLRSRDQDYQKRLRDRLAEIALPKLESGEFDTMVHTTMPWEQIVQAHEHMESNTSKGKIVCTIDW